MRLRITVLLLAAIVTAASAQNIRSDKGHENNPYYSNTDTKPLHVSNAEWKKILPPKLYAVARESSTETPFTGKYGDATAKGTYYCAVCGNKLFRSDAKFASNCGWPSFFEPVRKNSVVYLEDNSYGMQRTEVRWRALRLAPRSHF